MHAFAHPPAFAARSSRVARRFPFPPRRRATPAPESAPRTRLVARPRDARPARLARLGVAPRASAEDARRARTPRQARRDVHAPRTYTREDSVDGDESYSLLDAKGFGPPETETVGATSTWGAGTIHRARVASASSPDWPDRPDVVTASSTHTRHPHVVSVKLPRPVADHIKLAPRTAPPLSGAVAELRDLDETAGGVDFEPTGAVVTEVNPGFPGLAHGLVQPGDVLAVMVDEWKQPSDYFVRHAPFSAIERAAFERSDKPVTLRFERYVESETQSVDTRTFIGSHVGDRTSVHHSRLR